MRAPLPLSEGFSSDGFIRDQDCFSSVRYRTMPASINGCGWIAAFNLLHELSGEEDWDRVRRELDDLHPSGELGHFLPAPDSPYAAAALIPDGSNAPAEEERVHREKYLAP